MSANIELTAAHLQSRLTFEYYFNKLMIKVDLFLHVYAHTRAHMHATHIKLLIRTQSRRPGSIHEIKRPSNWTFSCNDIGIKMKTWYSGEHIMRHKRRMNVNRADLQQISMGRIRSRQNKTCNVVQQTDVSELENHNTLQAQKAFTIQGSKMQESHQHNSEWKHWSLGSTVIKDKLYDHSTKYYGRECCT